MAGSRERKSVLTSAWPSSSAGSGSSVKEKSLRFASPTGRAINRTTRFMVAKAGFPEGKNEKAGDASPAPPACANKNRLLQVLRNQFGHFKHRNDLLAVEHGSELFVGIDHAPIDGVLQLVLLDVVPKLLGDFGARHRI